MGSVLLGMMGVVRRLSLGGPWGAMDWDGNGCWCKGVLGRLGRGWFLSRNSLVSPLQCLLRHVIGAAQPSLCQDLLPFSPSPSGVCTGQPTFKCAFQPPRKRPRGHIVLSTFQSWFSHLRQSLQALHIYRTTYMKPVSSQRPCRSRLLIRVLKNDSSECRVLL